MHRKSGSRSAPWEYQPVIGNRSGMAAPRLAGAAFIDMRLLWMFSVGLTGVCIIAAAADANESDLRPLRVLLEMRRDGVVV